MDLLVLLTSLFQGERKNSEFQRLFSQLKGVIGEAMASFATLERMCETGEIEYQLIIDALRAPGEPST